MESHMIYCSACDRQVKVLFAGPPGETTAASEVAPNGVCTDYCSEACTGSMCALFDIPTAEMLEKLRTSGLRPQS